MRLVTINGPLGVGKTWVYNRLSELLAPMGVPLVTVNFQEPLKELTYQLLNVPSHFPYDLFKNTVYHGHSGRAWMIHLSESMKQLDPTIWVRKSVDKMIDITTNVPNNTQYARIFIADSQGFEVELDFLSRQKVVSLLSCSIEPIEYRDRRGQKYQEDDSRYNLAHLCEIVTEDSSEMYWQLKAALERRGWIP
jgi:hypothetical protein